MANSRSNIYPVQLQGAELNLNKFDAEIKQYSGFNKNNSPFVGGCLSNLFTKTEENTTGSSDSVYVDDEGNRYEIKYEDNHTWLFKNNTRVLKIENNGYAMQRVPVDNNCVFYERYYWGDYFYITKDNDNDFSFWADYVFSDGGKRSYGFSVNHNIYFEDYILDKVFFVRFDKAEYIDNVGQCIYKSYFRNRRTGQCYYEIGWTGENCYKQYEISEEDYIFTPPAVLFYTYNSERYLVIAPNSLKATDTKFFRYNLNNQTKSELPVTFNYDYDNEYQLWNGITAGCVFISSEFEIGTENNNGYMYTLQGGSQTINSTPRKFLLKACVRGITNNAGDTALVLDLSPEKRSISTPALSYTNAATLSLSMGKNNNAFILREWGCCYAIKTSDNKNFWGVTSDYLTNSVTLEEDGNGNMQPMFKMGGIINKTVLVNNGFVSGVGTSYILFSDWNTVSEDSISNFTRGNVITYKGTSGQWIEIRDSAFLLKEVNGLLVINSGGVNNCYRLSDGKILTFAPSWNNRAPKDNILILNATTDNNYYLASSINEYNLKDNASILLNPVPVVTDAVYVKNGVKKVLKNIYINNKSFEVNFYAGSINSNEFLYIGSSNQNTLNDLFSLSPEALYLPQYCYQDNLADLPFPLDTNGNVQLSPSLFCKTERFGNDVFIKEGSNAYQLIKDGAESVMSYYLGTLIENLEDIFILQGQYYAIINKQIFNVQFSGGVVQSLSFVVSVENLQFCGNSAYQAYFFSKTNRCIYVFTGANILNQLQLVDKISEIYAYKYNQSTQSIILITDLGTIISSNLGMYLLEGFTPDDVFFYDKGVVFVSDSELTYLQYYEADGFEKHNIELETCFYGMNNETVTINDCLYLRLFSEEHEEGEVKISATTISLRGRKTEETVFRFKASDWDALTHSVYVRYQPKEQRGLGISFSINSPFKIASMSIGSKADAILIDRVSKGAINAPEITSNNIEW